MLSAMDGKANVKSIMAKFNNNSAEDVHCHQVKAGGQTPLLKKTAFEMFAQLENASPPARPSNIYKPASVKLPLSTKPLHEASDKDLKAAPLKSNLVASKMKLLAQAASREANERPGFPKPLGPKPSDGLREETKPAFSKPLGNRLPGSPVQKNELKPPEQRVLQAEFQGSEAKPVFPKVAGVKEKFTSVAQENNPRPSFTKPPISQKPSQHFTQSEEISNKNAFLNQASSGSIGLKTKPGSLRVFRNAEEKSGNGTSFTSPFPPLKPAGNQSNLPQTLPKPAGQQNEEAKPRDIKTILKQIQEDSGSASSAPAAKAVSSSGAITVGLWANPAGKEEKDKNVPKRKTLPPPFTLGPAPQKPNRPPTVDLEKFKKDHRESSNPSASVGLPPPLPPPISTPQSTSSLAPPPPPAFHPSAQTPVLPPRMKIKPRGQENEENYDDVGFGSEGAGHADESQNSDGEMYEDIHDMRTVPQEDNKKKEKEEKKMKEHKEKDKKEQELRKKFKLMGPIEVIHQARARTDFKGGKNDLSFRQGDQIEILRITGNPEGKWLGRVKDGYIKTTMVEIDYDSLRKPRPSINIQPKHPDSDQEVYDDVGDQDSINSGSQSAIEGFPAPPPFVEIYDGTEDDGDVSTKSLSQDEEKNGTWSKGLLKILKGKDYQKKSVRGTGPGISVTEDNEGFLRTPSAKQTEKDSGDSDVYDDIESTDFPPPPKEISLGIKVLSFGRGRSNERDSQKIKKIDKEEKEFRKKFKYEGDIRVSYTTTILRAPSPKTRGSKDLQVKPGEVIEVIKNVDDTKILCRNEEGKYGYVRRSCIADEDEEIYDDIADGCLYDND